MRFSVAMHSRQHHIVARQHPIFKLSGRMIGRSVLSSPLTAPYLASRGEVHTQTRLHGGHVHMNISAHIHIGTPQSPPCLVTFDAYDTLFSIRASVGHWYRDACISELRNSGSSEAASLSNLVPPASAFDASFRAAYKHKNNLSPCFGARDRRAHDHTQEPTSLSSSHTTTGRKVVASLSLTRSEEWWYDVVSQTVLGAAAATRGKISDGLQEELSHRMPRLFASLYRKVFMSREVWAVHPNVHETLMALRAHGKKVERGPGALGPPLNLGIISNSDDRTAALLEELGLLQYFDFVLTAHEVGSEKPESVLFQNAIAAYVDRLKLKSDPAILEQADASTFLACCWHVGNSFKHDVQGAVASGWNAVLLNPPAVHVRSPELSGKGGSYPTVVLKSDQAASNRIYYEINDIRHLLTVLNIRS